ncbi:Lipoteichoic acid synthase LtaS Type IIb [Marinilactibacillus psychrotolerans 42ea]|uniref:Lipoteichoic acid synthase LtaS Type IIb n=1 Tax=Marinilactibacillus psychrotolerans 42ea TaxID=1255609 RepID=A0A1R4J9L0_9LACT|nr:LTA synthase family protein [Marinilactibacillus psychrotolerans]SJN28748.1 Lipoteichoic acid synthase LtaS Type IIb [Marinilactibacillus psychrotolerans 42ea]
MSKVKSLLSTRMGFFGLASILFWLKTYLVYQVEFNLGVSGAIQQFILLINPIAFTVILFSIALYFKKTKRAYIALFVVMAIASMILYFNVMFYREFSDFLTMNILLGSNNVSGAVVSSTVAMMRPWDIFYWLDFIILLTAILYKKKSPIKMDSRPLRKRYAVATTILGVALFAGNLALAESNRPQLLVRTFDRNYIVKYLGLNFFTAYDAFQTAQNNHVKASADESNLVDIVDFAKENDTAPNPEYFGEAKGRNVIVIAMESVQQFLIDYELEDENGEKHEVMPFVNSLFHDESSYSFDNFYHQVGQGKSSDAEILGENSLYGLPQGSAFQTLGSTNTFHAAPNILQQEAGYTSAAFHGNVGSFWNRNDTYQQFGYDYFFDSAFYDVSGDNSLEYGLKDKLFFDESVQYLEQLPQPFYTKFITVTNHFPYPLDEQNAGFPTANTDDETINQYFATANYADQAIEEFFNYLKASGLYDNSVIMLYGDHYGISNMRNPHLASLLGEDQDEWGDFQNTQMQKVPMIIHVPGAKNGQVSHKTSGQVDMLPTMMHLLGLETKDYLFMGQDMLSEEHDDTIPFRNGNVITDDYSFIGQSIYDNNTGEEIQDTLSEEELAKLNQIQEDARKELGFSDDLMMMDLLRFYTPESFSNVERNDYIYSDQLKYLENDPLRSKSLIEMNGGQSTTDLYKTDAPELSNDTTEPAKDSEGNTDNKDQNSSEEMDTSGATE